MTAMLFTAPEHQVLDANANPVSGAKAYFYQVGTLTDLTVYQDRARSIPHPQPVVADSGGWLPAIYPPDGNYKLVLKDAAGVDIRPALDDIAGPITIASTIDGGGDIAARILQVGAIVPWPSETIPAGWLECNGAAVSRTAYPDLYTKIGIVYGPGDGLTTFNLPDLRGRFLRGWDHGAGTDPDAASRTDRGDGTGGDRVGTKQADVLKTHSHDAGALAASDPGTHVHAYNTLTATGAQIQGGTGWSQTTTNTAAAGAHATTISGSTADNTGGSTETRPKNINLVFIILASAVEASAGTLGTQGLQYRFDTLTANTDPGAGFLRFNHATYASATALYISKTDAAGADNGGFLATWDNSTSTQRGSLQINKIGALGTNAFFWITGDLVDHTSYYEFPIQHADNSNGFATNDNISIQFSRSGDEGTADVPLGTDGYALMGNGVSTASFKGFLQAGTGAVQRTWNDKVKESLSAKDFGAVGDGSTDDAAALDAAWAAAKAQGRPLYIPAGSFRRSTDWDINLHSMPNGACIVTDGWSATRIIMDAGKVVTISGNAGDGIFYADIELHVVGNVAGRLITVGLDALTDAFNHCWFRLQAQNASANASNVGIRLNYLVFCTVAPLANCSGATHIGTAIEIKQTQSCLYMHGGGGNANIGWDISGVNTYSNVFLAVDHEEVNTGLKITNAFKNTWLGVIFSICTNYAIDGVSGSDNLILQAVTSAVGATFNGTTGVYLIAASDIVTKTATQTLSNKSHTGDFAVTSGKVTWDASDWVTWTPTVTAQTGSITTLGTVVAKYVKKGKTVQGLIRIPITTNGTGATSLIFTTPNTMVTFAGCNGIENATNKTIGGKLDTTTQIKLYFYDGTYPGANGNTIDAAFTYETT